MATTTLADRLRQILKPRLTPSTNEPIPGGSSPSCPSTPQTRSPEEALHGEFRSAGGGMCFVVEQRFEPSASCGRERVGELAERLTASASEAALVATGDLPRPPFVFLDLETTGLSGGAGTYAFLVGCGRFEESGAFATRQYVLLRVPDEQALLDAVSAEMASAGALVTFNGKTFDVPVLETRYLMHRRPFPCGHLPHVDVLHPARLFWTRPRSRDTADRGWSSQADLAMLTEAERRESGCSLGVLERIVLGAPRTGDIPGFEVPARYFGFLRSADPGLLADVLRHNRLDLLSLAALTSRLLHLLRVGPSGAIEAREALALGRVYGRAGIRGRALDAYTRAASWPAEASGRSVRDREVEVEALRALALCLRRARRFDEAANCWRRLLEMAECPARMAREAAEALAIHHEHRDRDLPAARAFALRSLGNGIDVGAWAGERRRPDPPRAGDVPVSPGVRSRTDEMRLSRVDQRTRDGQPKKGAEPQLRWEDAVRHRLERIDRKLNRTAGDHPFGLK